MTGSEEKDTKKLTKKSSRKAVKFRGPKCLNCGHPLELSDRYCSYCSQLNTSKQLALKDFLGEFIESVFTYDSRLRYTLKDLLFKPGTITNNYVKGQRLKYANPFRFFLSVSIIYFLLNSLITNFSDAGNPIFKVNGEPLTTSTSLTPENQKKVLEKVNEELAAKNVAPIVLDSILDENVFQEDVFDVNLERFKKDKDTALKYISEKHLDTLNAANKLVRRFTLYKDFYKRTNIKNSVIALDSLDHENTSFNRWLYSKNDSIDRIEENPFGFINYLVEKIPFFLFFFAPLFALFFWLIYAHRKNTYMEHLILIFHLFSFIFLGLLICLLPDSLLGTNFFSGIFIILVGPFYFYKSLRNFYKESRLITIIKFVILNIVFWISSTIAALIFFAITAATY